jgi:hypothetical protein
MAKERLKPKRRAREDQTPDPEQPGLALAEHAVRASGWRCLVYRLAPEEHAAGARR